MNTGDALVFAYLLDGKGGGKAVGMPQIETWTTDKGLLWIHLDSKIQETQVWLENKSGLSSLTCESLLEQETRPRNVQTDDGLLLILRVVNCNPGAEPEDMVAIRMLLTEHRIISMSCEVNWQTFGERASAFADISHPSGMSWPACFMTGYRGSQTWIVLI